MTMQAAWDKWAWYNGTSDRQQAFYAGWEAAQVKGSTLTAPTIGATPCIHCGSPVVAAVCGECSKKLLVKPHEDLDGGGAFD